MLSVNNQQVQQPERKNQQRRGRQRNQLRKNNDNKQYRLLSNPLQEDNPEILSAVKEVYPQINETLEAVVLDGSMKTLLKVPVSDVVKKLDSTEGAKC